MRRQDMREEDVSILARMTGIAVDPAHLPGVARNLNILLDQAALLFDCPIDALVEPAPVYRP